jgi:hypothetical protein
VRAARILVLVALAAAAASCGSSSSSSSSSTTTPTVTRVTTTLSGTVPVKGADVQTVTLTQSGQVDVTLVSAAPPASIVMGLGVGTLDPLNNCVIIPGASVNVAGASVAQLSGIFSPGTLCVQVKDIGQATSPVSYTVTVLHP